MISVYLQCFKEFIQFVDAHTHITDYNITRQHFVSILLLYYIFPINIIFVGLEKHRVLNIHRTFSNCSVPHHTPGMKTLKVFGVNKVRFRRQSSNRRIGVQKIG